MNKVFYAFALFSAFFLPSIACADESWGFDPTFQRTPLFDTSESASGVKVLSSGKVLTYSINGGRMSGANGQRIGTLIRTDPNTGAIDPTWHADPSLAGSDFLGVAEAPDGKIYISTALIGELPDANDPAIHRLIRLNTDGSRDTSFNSPVFAITSRFVTVQPDGKIIVCTGGINLVGNPPADSIVQTIRLNTDGSLDNTFHSPNFQQNASDPPPSVASGIYSDLGVFGNPVVDPLTGKIYFCGFFRFVNGQPRKGIVRCNADGTLDSSFVPTGLPTAASTQLTARAIVLQAGGKVVIGGTVLRTAAGGNTRYALLRFNADGTLDPSFTLYPTTNSSAVPLVPGYTGPRDIHALPDGKILTSDIRVLRFLPDGNLDPAFPPLDYTSPYFTNTGQVAGFHFDVNPNTGAAYLTNPGPLYARLGGNPVPGEITKLNANATIDAQFKSPVVQSEDFAPTVQLDINGRVYVSGGHTDFGNSANSTVTRLLADGTRDPSYSLDTLPFADKQAAGFALLPDTSAYVTYYSGSFNGGYQFTNLVRLLPTGAIDASFRPSSALQTALSINAYDGSDVAKSSVADISAAPAGKAYLFLEGAQATVNTSGNLKPVRVNADGSEDTTVPALGFPVGEVTRDANGITGGSAGYVHRLTHTPDGGFIILASVAPFPTSTGNPYNYKLLKLRANGSQDPNFTSSSVTSNAPAFLDFPVLFDPVTATRAQPLNGFYSAGGEFPISSAAVFADGSLLIAGKFLLNGEATTRSLAKLSATGALDTSFMVPSSSDHLSADPNRPSRLFNARIAPDGKIWVLGRFDTLGSLSVPGVARLNPDGTLDSKFRLTDVAYYDSFGDFADVVFKDNNTAYLIGTFRRVGEPMPFAVTRITNASPGPQLIGATSVTGRTGVPFSFRLRASGVTSTATINASGLPPGLSIDPTTGLITGTVTQDGSFTVTVNVNDQGRTVTGTLQLTFVSDPAFPIILSPTEANVAAGQPFNYTIVAPGSADPNDPTIFSISGTLPPGLTFDPKTGTISGTFTGSTFSSRATEAKFPLPDGVIRVDAGAVNVLGAVQLFATNSHGTATTQLVFLTPKGVTVANISTRMQVGTGDNVLIGGFIVSGTAPKKVIIRAVGPSLAQYNVPGVLEDPTLTLFDGTGKTIQSNDDWQSDQSEEINASGHVPDDPREAAIVATLLPGSYTAIVRGKAESAGVALVEIYDLDPLADSQMSNISTRGKVLTDDNVMIGGFILSNLGSAASATAKVLVRAVGPSLGQYGVLGTMDDPTLDLFDSNGTKFASDDNWRINQEKDIIGTGKAPTDDREAAILLNPQAGSFTAIVRGKDGSTGVALVEVYVLQ